MPLNQLQNAFNWHKFLLEFKMYPIRISTQAQDILRDVVRVFLSFSKRMPGGCIDIPHSLFLFHVSCKYRVPTFTYFGAKQCISFYRGVQLTSSCTCINSRHFFKHFPVIKFSFAGYLQRKNNEQWSLPRQMRETRISLREK